MSLLCSFHTSAARLESSSFALKAICFRGSCDDAQSCKPTLVGTSTLCFTMSYNFLTKFRNTYERWILLNTDSVRHIETLLKGSLFFLPGRFKEQELTSEFGTCTSSTSCVSGKLRFNCCIGVQKGPFPASLDFASSFPCSDASCIVSSVVFGAPSDWLYLNPWTIQRCRLVEEGKGPWHFRCSVGFLVCFPLVSFWPTYPWKR